MRKPSSSLSSSLSSWEKTGVKPRGGGECVQLKVQGQGRGGAKARETPQRPAPLCARCLQRQYFGKKIRTHREQMTPWSEVFYPAEVLTFSPQNF